MPQLIRIQKSHIVQPANGDQSFLPEFAQGPADSFQAEPDIIGNVGARHWPMQQNPAGFRGRRGDAIALERRKRHKYSGSVGSTLNP